VTIEKLFAEYVAAFAHKNYQHKGMDDGPGSEFEKLALETFSHCSQKQQDEAVLAWHCMLGGSRKSFPPKESPYYQEVKAVIARFRFMCQTNLFFLCRLLGYSKVTDKEYLWLNPQTKVWEQHNTHEEICNEFFVTKDPAHYKTFESFALACDAQQMYKQRLLLVPRGGFKALDLDTDIPTPRGFRKMADVSIGDWVFDDDGAPCRVIGESEVFVGRKCYEVEFSTGEKVVADADHLWITDARKDRENKHVKEFRSAKTTQEIADTLLCRKDRNHRVHLAKAAQFLEKGYTISPYVLGCWLGDGTASNSNFTCADEQIIDELRKEGEAISKVPNTPYLYVFNGGKDHPWYRMRSGLSLASRLRALNLLNNKHIPEEYLCGSVEQRFALLQGLMDTDGTCDARGHATFTNTNYRLAVQVRELVASLGFKAFDICEYDAVLDGNVISRAYQVGFKPYSCEPVFRLLRKVARQKPEGKVSLSKNRQIVAVREVATRPTKCIAVDSYNHTYLVGRGYIPTHNSSINMADCVQWVICFPEVTIGILTGKLGLAQDFVGEVKAHFTLDENFEVTESYGPFRPRELKDKLTGETTVSLFQVLFPEHCVKPDEGKGTEFQTPACTAGDKEPTIRATGIEQSLSGSHFCLLKLDDVVTEENCETITRIETINHRIGVDKALMHAFGFLDIIGTWYDERDYYGVQIAYDDKLHSASLKNETTKIYRRACWWPTAEALVAGKIESEWKASDVIMWFPAVLTFAKMRESSQTEPDVFPIKYLNDPRQINKIKFPRDLLIRRTLPHNLVPHQGMIVTTVDTAYSTQSWADYTVILTAVVHNGKFYIVNMVRGRFNEYQLPEVIAAVGMKWKPKQIVIEEVMGTKFVIREIRREMEKLKISIPVRASGLGQGNKSNSKAMKAKPVLRLLGDERLYFINSCESLEEIYTEMSQFTGTKDDKHDDIISALSLLVEVFAPYADMSSKINSLENSYVGSSEEFELHQMIYGLGKYAEKHPEFSTDDNPRTQYDLGRVADIPANDGSSDDPLHDLMG
jgi:phage terminase large subunit-like protein